MVTVDEQGGQQFSRFSLIDNTTANGGPLDKFTRNFEGTKEAVKVFKCNYYDVLILFLGY